MDSACSNRRPTSGEAGEADDSLGASAAAPCSSSTIGALDDGGAADTSVDSSNRSSLERSIFRDEVDDPAAFGNTEHVEPPGSEDDPPLGSGTLPPSWYRTPLPSFLARSRALLSQLTRSEISGSLGDLGTLIPLVVSLARQRSILLTPALFFAGLSNVLTGYAWDVPMCVQPMKSIAAVALSEGLSRETVTAAGILTGGMILVIGATNVIELVNVIVPRTVVSGLQIGVGLRLASKGIRGIQELGWVNGWDCIVLALVVALLCLYWLRETGATGTSRSSSAQASAPAPPAAEEGGWVRRILCCFRRPFGSDHPVGVYLFLIGAIFAAVELGTTDNADGQYDLPLRMFGAPVAVWAMGTVSGADWKVGFLEGALPQIPLTTLNSVISVCCLAHSLYPEKRDPRRDAAKKNDAVVSRRDVSVSVGLMNVLFCPFGGMPNCHGAGGLAGQHRLGARHGASVAFLGFAKILLAVFFGASLLTILDAFPWAVLGIMLGIAGQELATTGFTLLVASVDEAFVDADKDDASTKKARKLALRKSTVVATITAVVIVALGKTHYGALSGWVAHMVYGDGAADFARWIRRKRRGAAAGSSSRQFTEDGSGSAGGGSISNIGCEHRDV